MHALALNSCHEIAHHFFLVRSKGQGFLSSFVMEVYRHATIFHRIEFITTVFVCGTLTDVLYCLLYVTNCRILKKLIRIIWEIRNSGTLQTFSSFLINDITMYGEVPEIILTRDGWFVIFLLQVSKVTPPLIETCFNWTISVTYL